MDEDPMKFLETVENIERKFDAIAATLVMMYAGSSELEASFDIYWQFFVKPYIKRVEAYSKRATERILTQHGLAHLI